MGEKRERKYIGPEKKKKKEGLDWRVQAMRPQKGRLVQATRPQNRPAHVGNEPSKQACACQQRARKTGWRVVPRASKENGKNGRVTVTRIAFFAQHRRCRFSTALKGCFGPKRGRKSTFYCIRRII